MPTSQQRPSRFWPRVRIGLLMVGAVLLYLTQEIWIGPLLLIAGLFNLWLVFRGAIKVNWELAYGYAAMFCVAASALIWGIWGFLYAVQVAVGLPILVAIFVSARKDAHRGASINKPGED